MRNTVRTTDPDLQNESWDRGLILFRQGKLSEARLVWERLLETCWDAKLCYTLGELCLCQFDSTGAARYFSRYLKGRARAAELSGSPEIGLNLSAA